MLFTSWRDERTYLLTSYEQRYSQVKNIIEKQMEEYAICIDELNDTQHQLDNNMQDDDDDNYDLIAPGTQSTERQDEFEGAQDLHPEFNEGYD